MSETWWLDLKHKVLEEIISSLVCQILTTKGDNYLPEMMEEKL